MADENELYFAGINKDGERKGKRMKLLRPLAGTGAVFFPIGLPPKGTCEFATKKCLKYCYATGLRYPNYDIEFLIPEKEKYMIYRHFMELPMKWIVEKISQDLDGLQTTIIHWFGSGDCLAKDLLRISKIIHAISPDITQMGFTRNIELWKKYKRIFALTIENKRDIPKSDKEGMFSIPNYRKERTDMYSFSHHVRAGHCGPIICEDRIKKNLEHYSNCRTCRHFKTGCFD